MGLGKLLLKMSGGGSYGMIARNISYIYSSLSTSYARRFPSPVELYVTAGTIDTLEYLRKMQIFPQQIAAALPYVFAGQCSLEDNPVRHANAMHPTQMPDALVSFTMQMQCLIYHADKPHLPLEAILAEVIEAKPIIAEHVIATLRRCQDPSFRRPMWDSAIATFMHADVHAEGRALIGILPDGAVGTTPASGGAGRCHSVPQEEAPLNAGSLLEPQAAAPQFKSKHGPPKQMMAPGYPIPIPMGRAYLHRALRDFAEELSVCLKQAGHAPVAAVMEHLILHSWSGNADEFTINVDYSRAKDAKQREQQLIVTHRMREAMRENPEEFDAFLVRDPAENRRIFASPPIVNVETSFADVRLHIEDELITHLVLRDRGRMQEIVPLMKGVCPEA